MTEKQECPKCGANPAPCPFRFQREFECGTMTAADTGGRWFVASQSDACRIDQQSAVIAALTAENARLSDELKAEREKAREGLLADLENSVTTMTGFDAVTKNVNLHMTIELYEELRAALAHPTEAPKA